MSKNRTLANIISNDTSKIKSIYTDSDSVLNKTTLGLTVAAGTATYSSTNLLPGSASDGDQALVTDTNRLYIYSGSGWYNIALINNTPYWSTEASSSYDLNTDGTSTVITLLAIDSDGTQPEYIAVADSDFNQMATITKDSDNGRVFTIVPIDSDNGTAIAGTGTVTFKASDGVNLVQQVSTFSLSFGATYPNLLNSTDYALGTTGGTFNTSVKKQGTHSLYIVGNGVTSRNPGANSGSAVTYNDWTISLWFYIQSFYNYNGTPHVHLFNCNDKYQGTNGYSFGTKGNLISSNDTYWLASDGYNGSSYGGMTGNTGTNWVTGAWYHLVFSGSTTGPTIGAWITKEGQSFGNILSRETFGGDSATATRVTALKIGGTTGLYLHGSYGTASDGGNVYYDDFRIYNAKASSSDAQAIFDSAGDVTLDSNPMQSNLKLAYTFDNTANSIS